MTVELRSGGKPLVIVAGDEFTFTFTLGGSASISGATVTTSFAPVGLAIVVGPLTMTVTDATQRIVAVTLTEVQTGAFLTNADQRITTEHIADVKVVLSGVTVHSEDFLFRVRKAVTA